MLHGVLSQSYLPIFDKYTQENPQGCLRVKTDDKAKLCKKYSLNVVPTVLIFKKGKVTKRLDGTSGAGLNEKQLKNLMSTNVSCVKKKGQRDIQVLVRG